VDYLIVDLPPGTGDVALSLSQSVPVAGAVLVTTPQVVSVADTRRAIKMYEKLSVPAMGLIENMSHFVCPSCRTESDIFGKGGGETLAREMQVPFLGRIPIYEPIRVGGDTGVPIVVGEPDSAAANAFRQAAERLASQLAILALKPQSKAIPLTQVR
jgi:ATP-binding protein involved in chromosome partitioning